MSEIDKIVKVSITRQTTTPQMESFDGILLVQEFLLASTTPVFGATERIREYGSLAEVLAAGFGTTSFIYQAAAKVFSQDISPDRVYVGRKSTGVDGTETWEAALTAMSVDVSYGDKWYGLCVATRLNSDQQDIADWVQANDRLCILASADANIYASGTQTTIADYLKTNSLDRSAVIYSPNVSDSTDDDCPDAAWFGKMFPKDPGGASWAYKTLSGVATYGLTGAQFTLLEGRNANSYSAVAGVPVTRYGTVGSGEYLDVMHGIDWLTARIQNLVFTPIAQLDKVPFTDSGVQIIAGQLRAALEEGVTVGLLAKDSIVISAPKVIDVAADKKAARILPDVTFTAVLAGAIHKTEIEGVVSL